MFIIATQDLLKVTWLQDCKEASQFRFNTMTKITTHTTAFKYSVLQASRIKASENVFDCRLWKSKGARQHCHTGSVQYEF